MKYLLAALLTISSTAAYAHHLDKELNVTSEAVPVSGKLTAERLDKTYICPAHTHIFTKVIEDYRISTCIKD